MAGAVDPTTGLTPQQEAFAQAVASGATQYAACLSAYNWSPDTPRPSVDENASRLVAQPKISARIQALRDAAHAAVAAEHAWTLFRMVKQAEKHMEVALLDHPRRGPNVSAANGALEIIGKVTGLLADKPTLPQAPIQIVFISGGKTSQVLGIEGPADPGIVEGEKAEALESPGVIPEVVFSRKVPSFDPDPSQVSPDTRKAPQIES